jgi:hypothetical protein
MSIADFGAGRAVSFAGGFPGTFDQAAIGDKILHPGEPVNIVDFIEQHEAENLADARHGVEQIQGVGIMVLSGFDDGEFDVAQQRIVVRDEHQIDLDTFLHDRIGKARGNPVAVGFVGELFADGGQIILAVGILDMRQKLGPFVCQMYLLLSEWLFPVSAYHRGRLRRGPQ